MATAESVKAKIQGLIDQSNATTGNADVDLTTAVGALIAGFGQGGGDFPFEYEVTEYVHSEDWLDSTLGLASNFCDTYCNSGTDTEWAAYYCVITNNTATARAAQFLACVRYGTTVGGGISQRTENTFAGSTAVDKSRAFYMSAGSVITVHKVIFKEG